MIEELDALDKAIISSFGRVRTAQNFEHFARYFSEVYGSEFDINKKTLKTKIDSLVKIGIFEFNEKEKYYVLVADNLELVRWQRELKHALENMTRDDLAWYFGGGRYSQG